MEDALVFHATEFRHLSSIMLTGIGPAPGRSGHTRNTAFFDTYKFAESNSKYQYYVAVNMRHAIVDGHTFYQTERGKFVSSEQIIPLYFEDTMEKRDFFNMKQDVYDSWNELAWARAEAWAKYKREHNSESQSSSSAAKRAKVKEEEEVDSEELPWDE